MRRPETATDGTMDVILEITDTFIADYIYALALPAQPAPYNFPESTLANATSTAIWQYKPATSHMYLEPSQAAYLSAWPRDNIYRQAISLYMITWYVLPFSSPSWNWESRH